MSRHDTSAYKGENSIRTDRDAGLGRNRVLATGDSVIGINCFMSRRCRTRRVSSVETRRVVFNAFHTKLVPALDSDGEMRKRGRRPLRLIAQTDLGGWGYGDHKSNENWDSLTPLMGWAPRVLAPAV